MVEFRQALDQEQAYLAGFQMVCADEDVAEIAEGTLDRLSALAGTDRLRGVRRTGPGAWVLTTGDGAVLRVSAGRPARRRAYPPQSLLLSLAIEPGAGLPAARREHFAEVLEEVPFSPVELHRLARELPLLSGLVRTLPSKALGDTALMVMGHFMSDLVVQVETALALGARAEALTVIDKGYPYRLTHRVKAHLRRLGVTMFPAGQVAAAAESHARRSRSHGCARTVAVDDGGYVLPALLDERPDLAADYDGLVEQTMSGIYRLEKYGDRIPLPVLSVAQSRLKGTIESYWIAEAAVANLLRLMPGEKWEGRPALVIGYGQIGSEIAQLLRQRRMRVACHDRELLRLVSAHEHGYHTGTDLARLIGEHRPWLIVGSTGRTCLGAAELSAVRRDCVLASVTSRTVEFDLPALTGLAEHIEDLDVEGTRFVLPHGVRIDVLADGYPVNFHHAESVPNRQSDLIMAGLLVGAAALADPGHGFQPGHNVALSDHVLETSGLLADFYRLYGPDADHRPERRSQP
ncbi:Rossmann-fold NAD(P)-binding domain-containing protein [Catellatospora vulcania]|uniref:hypothetical protein n=1 Tax=Catellatospora vulcania TaxID=1460450 RepID=UPI0012D4A656|nr:hypothetical protein [Catellatospora vulcania]